MKSPLIVSGLFLAVASVHAGETIPALFAKKQFNSSTLVEAANHYISLGEERAVKALKSLAEDHATAMDRGFHTNERIGWICRIVFLGQNEKPLRQPFYGGLRLPYLTMTLDRWPLYPVAESEGVYFVLSEGYMLAGVAERAVDYIDYCSANGTLRKAKIKVPSHTEAITAFEALKNSERWKVIKWKDEGPGTKYTMSEEMTLRDLKSQASSIPKTKAEQGGGGQPTTRPESK